MLIAKSGVSNEIEIMYHGTSKTDPWVVLNSRHGIDFHFCNDGVAHGWGNYYAFNSGYSVGGYTFVCPD